MKKSAGAALGQRAKEMREAKRIDNVVKLSGSRASGSDERQNSAASGPSSPPNGEGVCEHVPRSVRFANFTIVPNLELPISLAFVAISRSGDAFRTISTLHAAIRAGFVRFVAQTRPSAAMEDLDEPFLREYMKWQTSSAATINGCSPTSATARSRLYAARRIFRELASISPWQENATRILAAIPRQVNRGAEVRATPISLLSHTDLDKIWRCSLAEIDQIRRRIEYGERLMAAGRTAINEPFDKTRKLASLLARLSVDFPAMLPSSDATLHHIRGYAKALGGWSDLLPYDDLTAYFYASSQDLVPFVLALSIEGAFNADSILSLKQQDVSEATLFGVPTVLVRAPKLRSGTGIYEKHLDPALVRPWFEILKHLTERLRPALGGEERDYLFVFSSRTTPGPTPFRGLKSVGTGIAWTYQLKKFCARHSITPFTLRQIRPTLIDWVGERSGPLAAQHAAQHRSFRTTDGHYLGPGTRARDRDRLGAAVQQMERWAASSGSVDVRRGARPPHSDKGAATPGFLCADPYDSPIVGERKGRLCRAYGQCVLCPLAFAMIDDLHAVASWSSLLRAVDQASDEMDFNHWITKWLPVGTSLNNLLKQVSPAVLAQAAAIFIPLAPIS